MARHTTTGQYFQIGIFVLIALGMMCTITLLVGFDRFFRQTTTYHAFFRKIPRTLQKSCLVYVDGMQAGRVSSMKRVLGTNGMSWIDVAMALTDTQPLGSSMCVRVEMQLVGGPASLLIAPTEPDDVFDPVDVAVEPDEFLPAKQLTRIELLEEKIKALLDNLNAVDMRAFNESIMVVTRELTQTLHAVNAHIEDPRIDELLASVCVFMGEGSHLVSNLAHNIDGKHLGESLGSVRIATSNLMIITSRIQMALSDDNLQTAVKNADRMVTAGTPALQDVRDLVAELRVVAATLNDVLENVQRNPSSLMFGRSVPKPESPGETK